MNQMLTYLVGILILSLGDVIATNLMMRAFKKKGVDVTSNELNPVIRFVIRKVRFPYSILTGFIYISIIYAIGFFAISKMGILEQVAHAIVGMYVIVFMLHYHNFITYMTYKNDKTYFQKYNVLHKYLRKTQNVKT